jgi:hypothetical protein
MLKFLFIIFLFLLGIYYIFILPFKPRQDIEDKRPNRKKAKGSNLDIDYIPEDKNQSKSEKFKGGDYIDYEEVK